MSYISPGDPQPIECHVCNDFYGYSFRDFMTTGYSTFYSANGELEGGAYSDYQNVINEGVTAYCLNCNSKLKFKLNRK